MSGIQNLFGFARGATVAPGSQSYTTAGTYSWVAPTGVTSVSVVAVGGGGTSGGGALGYKNNITVSPGTGYTVVVGAGTNGNGGNSYFINVCTDGICIVLGYG